jgi:hypothetical protein
MKDFRHVQIVKLVVRAQVIRYDSRCSVCTQIGGALIGVYNSSGPTTCELCQVRQFMIKFVSKETTTLTLFCGCYLHRQEHILIQWHKHIVSQLRVVHSHQRMVHMLNLNVPREPFNFYQVRLGFSLCVSFTIVLFEHHRYRNVRQIGQTSCTNCSAGTYSATEGTLVCILCEPGELYSFSLFLPVFLAFVINTTHALPVTHPLTSTHFLGLRHHHHPIGYYAPFAGQSSCMECPRKTAGLDIHRTSCQTCGGASFSNMPAGTFNTLTRI